MHKDLRDVTPWCRLRIDREGRWFYEDKEIVNAAVLHSFQSALELGPDGRYRIVLDHETCAVEVEDAPFVALSLQGDATRGFRLILNNGSTVPLDPSRLEIGPANVAYLRLPNGMPVRLARPAYYALAFQMEEDPDGNIVLRLGDATHIITPARTQEKSSNPPPPLNLQGG